MFWPHLQGLLQAARMKCCMPVINEDLLQTCYKSLRQRHNATLCDDRGVPCIEGIRMPWVLGGH